MVRARTSFRRTARLLPLALLGVLLAQAGAGLHAQERELPQGRRFSNYFVTGGTGPGVDYNARNAFLGGALKPETGWPGVFLDHFAPRPGKLCNLWLVQSRDCPQVMGADPTPHWKVFRFDPEGKLSPAPLADLLAQAAGRPVVIQVQGHLTTPDAAVGGLLWADTWLPRYHALPPGVVFVAFDWPSDRQHLSHLRDANHTARRAFVAGWHLAALLHAFPPEARVSLIGHSYGGRVVPAALHLLAGGGLSSHGTEDPVRLPTPRPDLRLRAVIVQGASDHHWLNPGERLGRALHACEAFLNLYSSRDKVLRCYPLLIHGRHAPAIGRAGLSAKDLASLGPLRPRFDQKDLSGFFGEEHTLLRPLAEPAVAAWLAPYLWPGDLHPDGAPVAQEPLPLPKQDR